MDPNPSSISRTTRLAGRDYAVADLQANLGPDLLRLPHVLRILAENVIRQPIGADERNAALQGFTV